MSSTFPFGSFASAILTVGSVIMLVVLNAIGELLCEVQDECAVDAGVWLQVDVWTINSVIEGTCWQVDLTCGDNQNKRPAYVSQPTSLLPHNLTRSSLTIHGTTAFQA